MRIDNHENAENYELALHFLMIQSIPRTETPFSLKTDKELRLKGEKFDNTLKGKDSASWVKSTSQEYWFRKQSLPESISTAFSSYQSNNA